MRLLSDNPTDQDKLGFDRVADVLYTAITTTRERPLTLGVFGSWGTGKTSLMRMVERKLRDDENVKTVWFSAWKYDGKEVMWNALIQTIFLAMKRDLDAKQERSEAFRKRVLDASKVLARYAAKVSTRLIPGGVVKEEDVDALLDALGSAASDREFDFVNRFEDEFESIVGEYVGAGGYLVVFIDDLDRCLPENAIEILEALKLYLDRGDCVFVLGVDPAAIEEAIRQRYSGNPSLSPADYLEKIVQLPVFLPRMRSKLARELASPAGPLPGVEWGGEMDRLVRAGLDRNPRRVKRLVNALGVASQVLGDVTDINQLTLAKVLVVQMSFPDFYRRLRRDPGLIAKVATEPEAAWREEGVGSLYADDRLRDFLKATAGIPSKAKDVRAAIRLAQSDPEEESADVD